MNKSSYNEVTLPNARTVRLPHTNASIDKFDLAYGYNLHIEEDDYRHEPEVVENNNINNAKQNAYQKRHFRLDFSGFSFAVLAISSVLSGIS
jgi:hypothetical protein